MLIVVSLFYYCISQNSNDDLLFLTQNDTKRSDELKNKYSAIRKIKREDDDVLPSDEQVGNEYQQQYLRKLETRCESKQIINYFILLYCLTE